MTTTKAATISSIIAGALMIIIFAAIYLELIPTIFIIVIGAIGIQNIIIVRYLASLFYENVDYIKSKNFDICDILYKEFPNCNSIMEKLRDMMISSGINPREENSRKKFIAQENMNIILKDEKKQMKCFMKGYMSRSIKSSLTINDILSVEFDDRVFSVIIEIMLNIYERDLIHEEIAKCEEEKNKILERIAKLKEDMVFASLDDVIDMTE